jgi:hypothetical protein
MDYGVVESFLMCTTTIRYGFDVLVYHRYNMATPFQGEDRNGTVVGAVAGSIYRVKKAGRLYPL